MARKPGRREYVPERGDVVWLTFSPQAGHEQAGRRPAVVLSPAAYNRRSGLMIAVPVTSHVKGYPFEVALLGEGSIKGAVLADHIRSVDWRARKVVFIEVLPAAITRQILQRAALLLAV